MASAMARPSRVLVPLPSSSMIALPAIRVNHRVEAGNLQTAFVNAAQDECYLAHLCRER